MASTQHYKCVNFDILTLREAATQGYDATGCGAATTIHYVFSSLFNYSSFEVTAGQRHSLQTIMLIQTTTNGVFIRLGLYFF